MRAPAPDGHPPGSQSSLHRANVARVLRAVRAAGTLSQAEISRRTGLSAATVSNIVHELADSGAVEVETASAGGRRIRRVTLSSSAGVVVGVDFGHSHLRVAIGDLSHRVLAADREAVDVDASAEDCLGRAEQLIDTLLARAGTDRDRVLAVGLGVPGPIDVETGEIGSSALLPGWVGVRPREALAERLGMPVHADNDANLGALGELVFGAGRGQDDLVYLKVSTGVGAGLVLGGRIYHGAGGTAGEIGHITLDESGAVCRCGNRGCLETHANAKYLLSLLRDSHGPELTVAGAVALAQDGDPGCRRVLADIGRHLGIGVASLCNLINPRTAIIGGDLAGAGDLLIGPLRESVARYAIPSAARQLRVVPGTLGDRAEVLGALACAMAETDHAVVVR
ncbi:MAG TPA: ROK family transcriptional regulator [Actinocatenispora sp.]